ncbi:hypothetical protein KR093_009267 [Drosophila rubida]|uniref:EF-hand domain-containing protein n=1 Tax=Drosophila rubida TaxID=30044 RepID=A0AAD4K1I6_9MUSC|nr:hypothetical protein KR093_009267 [Drosophila rubida]
MKKFGFYFKEAKLSSVINMDLSPRELQEFQHAFDMLDSEHDGSITFKDLATFIRNLGKEATENELLAMINEVDADGNGSVEFAEFVTAMTMRMCRMPDDDELREAFRVFDRDNSGYITVEKIRNVMVDLSTKVTEEEIEEMLRDANVEFETALSFEDFSRIMTGV